MSMRTVIGGIFVVLMAGALIWGLAAASSATAAAPAQEPPAPTGQTYTGAKRCASCHFEQYTTWKETKHAKSFDSLAAEDQAKPKCLKCHTTGYGTPTGYKNQTATASLAGTTCESCHGPGSKHEEVCQPFAKVKKFTPAQEKLARDSIWMMLPKNVCIECHSVHGHKNSETPTASEGEK